MQVASDGVDVFRAGEVASRPAAGAGLKGSQFFRL